MLSNSVEFEEVSDVDGSSPRRYAIALLVAILLPVLALVGFTAFIDPLWIMPNAMRVNIRHCVKDERQNKINLMLYGRDPGRAVIIGSSRSAFLDPADFGPGHFNLSVNGMRPIEFAAYLRLFAREHGAPEVVYVGFDEFGLMEAIDDQNWVKKAENLYQTAKSPEYRINQLLSVAVLRYAFDTTKECQGSEKAELPRYTKDGIRDQVKIKSETAHARINAHVPWFRDFYRTAKIDPELSLKIAELRTTFPNTRFVPFVTPIRRELLEYYALAGRLPEMEGWLRTIISILGPAYVFMTPSKFSASDAFFDGHHFYTGAGRQLANVLTGRTTAQFDDIGGRVELANLRAHMEQTRTGLCRTIAPARRASGKLDCNGVEELQHDPELSIRMSRVPYEFSKEPANWVAGTENSSFKVGDGSLEITTKAKKYEYIWISQRIPLLPDMSYQVNYDLGETGGSASIAMLSDQRFTKTENEATGKGTFSFHNEAESGQIVMFHNGTTPSNLTLKTLSLRR